MCTFSWVKKPMATCTNSQGPVYLGDTGFFRLQGIKVFWSLQFLGYLRTLSLKFQKASSKIKVVLALPGWLSQFSWDSQQGRARTTSILLEAFWNFKLKVLKYSQVPNKRVYSFIPNERVGLLFWANFIGLNKRVGWKIC